MGKINYHTTPPIDKDKPYNHTANTPPYTPPFHEQIDTTTPPSHNLTTVHHTPQPSQVNHTLLPSTNKSIYQPHHHTTSRTSTIHKRPYNSLLFNPANFQPPVHQNLMKETRSDHPKSLLTLLRTFTSPVERSPQVIRA